MPPRLRMCLHDTTGLWISWSILRKHLLWVFFPQQGLKYGAATKLTTPFQLTVYYITDGRGEIDFGRGKFMCAVWGSLLRAEEWLFGCVIWLEGLEFAMWVWWEDGFVVDGGGDEILVWERCRGFEWRGGEWAEPSQDPANSTVRMRVSAGWPGSPRNGLAGHRDLLQRVGKTSGQCAFCVIKLFTLSSQCNNLQKN